jgi:hypothetical protein
LGFLDLGFLDLGLDLAFLDLAFGLGFFLVLPVFVGFFADGL